jgi:hypothetical protein
MTRREFMAATGVALAGARAAAAGEARRLTPWKHATIPPRAGSMVQLMAQEKGSTFVSISRGAKVKVVGSTGWVVPYVFTKGDIKSLKELAGRSIPISQPGALAEVLARAMLEKEGLDATVASERAVRDRFGDLVRFCTALTRGIRYSMERRDETIDLGVRVAKRDRAGVARTYDWFLQHKALEPDFFFPPEGIKYMQDLNVTLGTQARVVPPEEVAIWDARKRVVSALGPYRR